MLSKTYLMQAAICAAFIPSFVIASARALLSNKILAFSWYLEATARTRAVAPKWLLHPLSCEIQDFPVQSLTFRCFGWWIMYLPNESLVSKSSRKRGRYFRSAAGSFWVAMMWRTVSPLTLVTLLSSSGWDISSSSALGCRLTGVKYSHWI